MAVFIANFLVEGVTGVMTAIDPTFLFGREGLHGGGRIASAFFSMAVVAQALACLAALRAPAARRSVALMGAVYHIALFVMAFMIPEFRLIGQYAATSMMSHLPVFKPYLELLGTSQREMAAVGCLVGIHGLLAIGFVGELFMSSNRGPRVKSS